MIDIDGMKYILLADACLYVDVTCYRCKHLTALSNSQEIDGRRYCPRCAEIIEPRTEAENELL